MKIGILTFWKSEYNYGQLLQCYATHEYLKSLGHEPFLVCATNGKEYTHTFKDQLIDKLHTAFRLKKYPWYLTKRAMGSLIYLVSHGKLRQRQSERRFDEFRKRYLNCSRIYTLEELHKSPPEADAFIAGSDQVWNTTDGMYFLSWAKPGTKKLSIAASFGANDGSQTFCDLIRPWLKDFSVVTVRESSGLEICRKAGREDAVLVPDPTLMLDKEAYLKIAEGEVPDSPYLFIYFLETRTYVNWKEIHNFAKNKGLKIVYIANPGQEDKFKKEEASIPRWLKLMSKAEYVLTNSYHGTIFALQFNRKFMVYPVSGVARKMNNRLQTLLTPIGLTDRIYHDSIYPLNKDIDYSIVNKNLLNLRKIMNDALNDVI